MKFFPAPSPGSPLRILLTSKPHFWKQADMWFMRDGRTVMYSWSIEELIAGRGRYLWNRIDS